MPRAQKFKVRKCNKITYGFRLFVCTIFFLALYKIQSEKAEPFKMTLKFAMFDCYGPAYLNCFILYVKYLV